ncbi:hypothetical protein EC988_006230, partial [Linderina pennispora]
MTSGPVIALLLDGDDVIRGWRMMIGPTDSEAARQTAPLSLRALLGANLQYNAVHGSDSLDSAKRELTFFFSPRIQHEEDPEPVKGEVEEVSDVDNDDKTAEEPAASGEDKKKKKKKSKRRKRKQTVSSATPPGPETPATTTAAVSDASDAENANANGASAKQSVVELAQPSDPMYERTFGLIKPDAYPRYRKQITKHIIERGFTIVAQEQVVLTTACAERLYSEMRSFPIYSRLIEFVTSGPVLALVLEGIDAVDSWRGYVGPALPKSARFEARDSLRAKYGTDAQMNAVHASKDSEAAASEIETVFYGLLGGKYTTLTTTDDPLATEFPAEIEHARAVAEAAAAEAEEEARRKAEEEAKAAAEEARLKAEEEARIKAEEETRLQAEEEARLIAAEEARLKAEEEARAAAEEARLQAEEEARIAAEAAAAEEARLKAEEEARITAEAAAAEEARLKAEADAKAAEEARVKAEEEARVAAEEARLQAEEEARIAAEAAAAEEARLKAEEEARLKAEEEARLKAEADAKAAEEARIKAEEEA